MARTSHPAAMRKRAATKISTLVVVSHSGLGLKKGVGDMVGDGDGVQFSVHSFVWLSVGMMRDGDSVPSNAVPSSTAAADMKLTVMEKTNRIIRISDHIVEDSSTVEVQDGVMVGEGDSKGCNFEGVLIVDRQERDENSVEC